MPTVEEYLRFSLEDWQAVEALKGLVRDYATSNDIEPLQNFLQSNTLENLIKYAIHFPAFEEMYRWDCFKSFWADVIVDLGLPAESLLSSYDVYKQSLITDAISHVTFSVDIQFDTPEDIFYFLAINALVNQARLASEPENRREIIAVFLAMEQSVGYLGSLMLSEIYMQIDRALAKEPPIESDVVNPKSFFIFPNIYPLNLASQQASCMHLCVARSMLQQQRSGLPECYFMAIERMLRRLCPEANSLDDMIASFPIPVQAQAIEAASQHAASLLEKLGLPMRPSVFSSLTS